MKELILLLSRLAQLLYLLVELLHIFHSRALTACELSLQGDDRLGYHVIGWEDVTW